MPNKVDKLAVVECKCCQCDSKILLYLSEVIRIFTAEKSGGFLSSTSYFCSYCGEFQQIESSIVPFDKPVARKTNND